MIGTYDMARQKSLSIQQHGISKLLSVPLIQENDAMDWNNLLARFMQHLKGSWAS